MTHFHIKIVFCINAAGLSTAEYLLIHTFPSRYKVVILELRLAGIESNFSHDSGVLLKWVDERLYNVTRTLLHIVKVR